MVEINLHGGDRKGLVGFAGRQGHFFGRFGRERFGRDGHGGLGKLAAGNAQVDLDIGTRAGETNHCAIDDRHLADPFAIDIGAIGANINDFPRRTSLP
jgi:hypothetical protein